MPFIFLRGGLSSVAKSLNDHALFPNSPLSPPSLARAVLRCWRVVVDLRLRTGRAISAGRGRYDGRAPGRQPENVCRIFFTANQTFIFTAGFYPPFSIIARRSRPSTSPAIAGAAEDKNHGGRSGFPGPGLSTGSMRSPPVFSPRNTASGRGRGRGRPRGQGGGARDPSVARAFHQDGSAKVRTTSSTPTGLRDSMTRPMQAEQIPARRTGAPITQCEIL